MVRSVAAPDQSSQPAMPAAPAPSAGAESPAAVPAAPSTSAAPSPHRTVLELLSDARVAFRDERTLFPGTEGTARGDSALELYEAVLAQDPRNEEAHEGIQRLLSVARSRIQSALAAGKTDDATRLVAAFRDAGTSAEALAKLQADVTAARQRGLPAPGAIVPRSPTCATAWTATAPQRNSTPLRPGRAPRSTAEHCWSPPRKTPVTWCRRWCSRITPAR